MTMISVNEFKNGLTIQYNNDLWRIVEFQHVKPGKGAAFVRTKLRNVISGGVVDRTFNPTEKLQDVVIERKEMQYLYSDGELYYFMDQETYEQIPLNFEKVEDAIKFLKENMFATIKFYKGEAFSVEAPNFVELQITHSEPGVKGNTTTNALKPATVETGAIVNVPMFVNEGDTIRIDTRTGEYMERV